MNKNKKASNVEIGENLRKLRLTKDVSIAAVARAIGRNHSTYSRYENGTYRPSNNIIKLLADYFGVAVNDIIPVESIPIFNSNSANNNNCYEHVDSTIFNQDFAKKMQDTLLQILQITLENQKAILSLL
jgi:transcriptional regulator with XRE-family HTH domain